MMNMKRVKILAAIVFVVVIAICFFFVNRGFTKNDRNLSTQPVTTNPVTVFTDATAILGVTIHNAGTPPYAERGVVYATSPNPTTANHKLPVAGSETGSFSVKADGLSAKTRYYVRAYATHPEGTIYGAQVRFATTDTTNARYILDDDTAETSLIFSDNHSLGNQFYVAETGVLTSVDVYAQHNSANTGKQVVVDVYDAQRKLTGSSASFTLADNDWVTVPLNNLPYSGTFYVMVRWTASEAGTHGLGYDANSDYANAGFNWLRNNNGTWSLLHEASTQHTPGIFMIRANANTSGTGTVKAIRRLPSVATIAATAVTASTVNLSASVIHTGTPPFIERGIVYCTHTNPAVSCAGKMAVAETGTGNYSVHASGLRANTTYYARAYALIAEGPVYGNEIIFTTSGSTDIPMLTTNTINNITATTATIDGSVVNTGTPEYSERGIVYCTHSNPLITCTGKLPVAGTGTGSFSAQASGLRANTTYYARAYAINGDGAFYGNEMTFTTSEAAVVEEP